MSFRTLEWANGSLRLLDQTQLPHRVVYLDLTSYQQVADAIRTMQVRGAPAIGVAAAFGLALGARAMPDMPSEEFLKRLQGIRDELAATRPTAVNLAWALDMVMTAVRQAASDCAKGAFPSTSSGNAAAAIRQATLAEAQRLAEADVAANSALGCHGAALIPDGARVLTQIGRAHV
jgi:methylthioribose-1-phosphate isomerase